MVARVLARRPPDRRGDGNLNRPLVSPPSPRRSIGGETRLLRDRHAALAAAIDRRSTVPTDGAARQLVQVFNNGAMPTANDHYFSAHPVNVGGEESEGSTPTFDVNTTQVVIVDVLGSTPPSVGDMLVATGVGGRWVAEKGGTTGTRLIQVNGCNSFGYPGVTVNFFDHVGGTLLGSCVTDALGIIYSSCIPDGTYFVTVTGASIRFAPFGQTLILKKGVFKIITLVPASGYVCVPLTDGLFGCLLPLATTLHVTDTVLGTATITYSNGSSPPTWFGASTYAFPGGGFPGCPAKTITIGWVFQPNQLSLTHEWVYNDSGSNNVGCPTGLASPFLFNPIYTLFNDIVGSTPLNASWVSVNAPSSYDCPASFSYSQTVAVAIQDTARRFSANQLLYQNWGPFGTLITTQTVTE